jgi:hypothetical protein
VIGEKPLLNNVEILRVSGNAGRSSPAWESAESAVRYTNVGSVQIIDRTFLREKVK